MYKYFTWTDSDGYFRGQQLLHRSQIAELLRHSRQPEEAFATIQDYDQDGNCIGCPVYFDIDSPSLWDAYSEMQELVEDLRATLEIEPLVYFSGSKGFHVVCPIYIRHDRCHELVKMMIDDITDIGDRSVYRARSMWRCNETWNAKGKGYKVSVRPNEKLEQMQFNSSKMLGWDGAMTDLKFRDADISGYISRLPTFKERMTEIGDDFAKDFKPCMKKIWDMDIPPEGIRHMFGHVMARHCYRSGLSQNEAVALFANKYPQARARDYEKVITSVYRTGKGLIGCKSGRDSEVLQPYCSKICNLNNEMKIGDFIGGRHE